MVKYTLRRALLVVLGAFLASIIIFFVLRVLPGDVAQVIAGVQASPEQIAHIRAELGLDRSLLQQYLSWIGGVLHLDFGTSLVNGASVGAEILAKLSVSAPLVLLAMLIAVGIGVPLGTVAAIHHDRIVGRVLSFVAQAVAAVPLLWGGLLLILLLGRGVGLIGILPSQGFPVVGWQDPLVAFAALILPAVVLGLIEGAALMRIVRSSVLETMQADFVRTAAATGLTKNQAIWHHALPNASLTILSNTALQAASMITGAVVVETLFALPGLGSMLVTDVGNRDLTKVQGTVLVITVVILLFGFLVDVLHRILDPRQRRGVAL